MTDFDKELIAKAENMSRYQYRDIDALIPQARTKEARRILSCIRWEKYDLVQETI